MAYLQRSKCTHWYSLSHILVWATNKSDITIYQKQAEKARILSKSQRHGHTKTSIICFPGIPTITITELTKTVQVKLAQINLYLIQDFVQIAFLATLDDIQEVSPTVFQHDD